MRRALRRLCFYLQGGKKGSALNIAHSLSLSFSLQGNHDSLSSFMFISMSASKRFNIRIALPPKHISGSASCSKKMFTASATRPSFSLTMPSAFQFCARPTVQKTFPTHLGVSNSFQNRSAKDSNTTRRPVAFHAQSLYIRIRNSECNGTASFVRLP